MSLVLHIFISASHIKSIKFVTCSIDIKSQFDYDKMNEHILYLRDISEKLVTSPICMFDYNLTLHIVEKCRLDDLCTSAAINFAFIAYKVFHSQRNDISLEIYTIKILEMMHANQKKKLVIFQSKATQYSTNIIQSMIISVYLICLANNLQFDVDPNDCATFLFNDERDHTVAKRQKLIKKPIDIYYETVCGNQVCDPGHEEQLERCIQKLYKTPRFKEIPDNDDEREYCAIIFSKLSLEFLNICSMSISLKLLNGFEKNYVDLRILHYNRLVVYFINQTQIIYDENFKQ
ncbi:hypothetical protein COBT_000654 [Conglomerata obtusa]